MTVKYPRPKSWQIGTYTLREDAGAPKGADGRRVVRVFTGSVAIFHGTEQEAFDFTNERVAALSIDIEELTDADITCPRCSGPGEPLGRLGSRLHVRCRNCGTDYSREVR